MTVETFFSIAHPVIACSFIRTQLIAHDDLLLDVPLRLFIFLVVLRRNVEKSYKNGRL